MCFFLVERQRRRLVGYPVNKGFMEQNYARFYKFRHQ
jgi:hypothetical protein